MTSLWYDQRPELAPHLHTGRRQQRTLFAQQGAKTNDGDLFTRPVTASGLVSKDFHCHLCLMSEYVDFCKRVTISDSMAHQLQQVCGPLEMSYNVSLKNSCIHSVRHLSRQSNLVTLRSLQLIVTDFAVRS